MKHTWVFTLLLGGVVGAFGALLAVDDGRDRSGPSGPATVVPQATAPAGAASPAARALDPGLDDAGLLRELEVANFERDWGRVAEVAAVLRERARRPLDPSRLVAEAAQDRPAPSLVLLEQAYRRAVLAADLARRDNPATRAYAADVPVEERERRLLALVVAPPGTPAEEVTRADAALLLARLARPSGRQALLELLDGPAARAAVVATALAQADDALATDAVLRALESDRDPGLRARLADALADAPGLTAGELVPATLARVALTDRDPAVRTHAVAALARADLAGSPSAREALARLLDDDAADEVVRRAVVAALRAHTELARGLPVDLVTALDRQLDRTSGRLRCEVAAALGEAAPGAAAPRLEAALLAASAPDERAALGEALARVRVRVVPE